MSTKTIYKRIALVAVATLGAGVLSVAPAFAIATVLTVTAGTPAYGDSNTKPTVGSTVRVPVTLAINWDDAAAAEAMTIVGTITTPNNAGTVAVTADVTGAAGTYAGTATAGEVLPTAATTTISYTSPSQGIDQSDLIGGMNFTPTVPGNYVLTLTPAVGATGGTARTVNINVGGVALTQGNADLGKATTGTQIVGRLSTVTFNVPSGASAGDKYQITSTSPINTVFSGTANLGAGVAAHTASTGVTTVNGVNYTNGAVYTVQAATTTSEAIAGNDYDSDMEQVSVGLDSLTAAGVVTVLFRSIGATTGALTTVGTATITYGSADLLTLSVANTTIHKAKSNDAPNSTTDAVAIVQSAVVGTQRANILVTVNNGNNTALNAQTISATIAGPGLIAWDADGTGVGTAAGSVSFTAGASENVEYLVVSGTGVGGVATITFAIGTTILGTETITFYGSVATLTAKQNHRIASSAGAALGTAAVNPAGTSIATTPAVVVTARDAQGVVVPGLASSITALSSDTTVMSNTITIAEDDGSKGAGAGNYNAQVSSVAKASGSTATLTFRIMSGTTVLVAAAPITYTLGGAVASVALSLDAASYESGAPAVATITVKDASGNAAFDADHASMLVTGGLASSLSVTGTLKFSGTDTVISSLSGVATVAFNAPGTSAAAWTISGTTGTGPSAAAEKGKALSATAAVTNAAADAATDAANEATDAANAATDAALAAADAADAATAAAQDAADAVAALSTRVSTLVSDLRKQISALTKLVKRLL